MKKYDKIRKKSTLYLASGALVISAVIPAASPVEASTYGDVTGNDHAVAIDALTARGILNGYLDGYFRPNKTLSRSDVTKIIGKYLVKVGYEIPADYKTYMRFSDLTPSSDEELLKYAALTYDLGIFKGDNGKLNASSPIVREHIAAVFTRLMNLMLDVDVSSLLDLIAAQGEIKDLSAAGSEYHTAIALLAYFDITIVSDFRAKESTTRGQMASFVYRLLENVLENAATINRLNELANALLISFDDLEFINDTVLAGSNGVPNTIVTVKDSNGNTIGSGTVGSDGKFEITLTRPVQPGEKIDVIATKPNGGTQSGSGSAGIGGTNNNQINVPDNVAPTPSDTGGDGNLGNTIISVNNQTIESNSDSITVVGKYGTLTMNKETGAYTYVSDGKLDSIEKEDTFTYEVRTRSGNVVLNTLIVRNTPAGTNGNNSANLQSSTATLPFSFSLGDGNIFATPQVSFNQEDE